MGTSGKKLTDTFSAKGSDGKTYRVNEMTEFRDTTMLTSKQKESAAGLKSYQLDNGEHVNQNSPTQYTIVRSGVRLTKIGKSEEQ